MSASASNLAPLTIPLATNLNPLQIFSEPKHTVMKGIHTIPQTSAFIVWAYLTQNVNGIFLTQIQIFNARSVSHCEPITTYSFPYKISQVVPVSATQIVCRQGSGKLISLKLDLIHKSVILDPFPITLTATYIQRLDKYLLCKNTAATFSLHDPAKEFKTVLTLANNEPKSEQPERPAIAITTEGDLAYYQNDILEVCSTDDNGKFVKYTEHQVKFLNVLTDIFIITLPNNCLLIVGVEKEKESNGCRFFLYDMIQRTHLPILPTQSIHLDLNKCVFDIKNRIVFQPTFQGMCALTLTTGEAQTHSIFKNWKETYLGMTENQLLIVVHNESLLLLETLNSLEIVDKVVTKITSDTPLPPPLAKLVSDYYLDLSFFAPSVVPEVIRAPEQKPEAKKNLTLKGMCKLL